MSKIKNGELDQYGAGHLEQQQFGTAGVEGVNLICLCADYALSWQVVVKRRYNVQIGLRLSVYGRLIYLFIIISCNV